MKNTGIEDISIDNSIKNKNKSGKNVIIILLFLLLIIFISLIILYKFYSKKSVSIKQLFVDGLLKTNYASEYNIDNYKKIYDRIISEDSVITNNITYSSNRSFDIIKDFDINSFSVSTTTDTDIENSKFFSDVMINYSGNEFLDFKVLSDKEKIGLMSDSIVNKYVGMSYDKLKDIYSIGNPIDYLKNDENIELSDENKKEYLKKYINIILDKIPEENFSMKENIALDESFQNIAVKEYKLELNQEDLINILVEVLKEFRNDEEFLEKISLNNNTLNIKVKANNADKNIINEPDEVQTEDAQENQNENIEENIDESILEAGEMAEVQEMLENLSVAESILPDGTTINIDEIRNDEKLKISDILPKINDTRIDYKNVIKLILGKKMNTNINSIQKEVDYLIEKIQKLEGSGLIVKLYVSDEGTEKIVFKLPNDSDFEIEFHNKNQNEKSLVFTYLYLGNNGRFTFSDDVVKDYILADDIENSDGNLPTQDKKNGFSVEYKFINGNSQNSINVNYNFIESEKINKKINFSINTTGNINSKTIKNDIVIISSGEEKDELVIENAVEFDRSEVIQEFSDNNLLLIDNLSEDDESEVLKAIILQLKNFRENKKQEVNLIDTSNQKYFINRNYDNLSHSITYEEAKNVLVEKISSMMGEAQSRNEEFTIKNLSDLTIDGYNVSSTVTDENATVVIDIYTFNIDSNFVLTDAN